MKPEKISNPLLHIVKEEKDSIQGGKSIINDNLQTKDFSVEFFYKPIIRVINIEYERRK